MADVLVPDTTGPLGARLAADLEGAGHRVHRCVTGAASDHCIGLTEGRCPLDTAPIDVAVAAANEAAGSSPVDGATCAARRRIPLVLVGADGDHPLAPWAAATAGTDRSAEVVDDLLTWPLLRHTAEAERAMLHELRRQGARSEGAAVAVYRRPGRLLVELTYGDDISRTQAERLATHVAQAVRGYDRWAPKLDVTLHQAAVAAIA